VALKRALTLMNIQKGFFTIRILYLNKRAMEAKWDPVQHFLQHAFLEIQTMSNLMKMLVQENLRHRSFEL
jgi:hypothetical protein